LRILFFLPILLFAFNVEFTKVYTKYIVPKKDAILIETKSNNISFPFQYYKVKNGYLLTGNMNQINNYLNNKFYAPDDAKFKRVKIAKPDYDTIQYNIINKLQQTYKTCNIKNVIFLSPDEDKIILKPSTIKLKYKIILDCK